MSSISVPPTQTNGPVEKPSDGMMIDGRRGYKSSGVNSVTFCSSGLPGVTKYFSMTGL